MRPPARVCAPLTLVAALVVTSPTAHAEPNVPVHCYVSQNGGDATIHCYYVAVTDVGFVRVDELAGDITGYVLCDRGGGASQRHTGVRTFTQSPGDLCHVTMVVNSPSAVGRVTGGSRAVERLLGTPRGPR